MASHHQQCGDCLQTPPPWQRLYCIGNYDFPLSQYLHQIKYQRRFWLIAPLAALLANHISTPAPQFVYVPSRWRRQLNRGFNQSELLAYELTKHFPDSHLLYDAFRLKHGIATQQSLTRTQRIRNLKHAFTLKEKTLSSHVAIIDDVVTTGSTVRHLSELLLEHGVKKIDIYCLCRTPDNSNQ
jgi:ComF family protein